MKNGKSGEKKLTKSLEHVEPQPEKLNSGREMIHLVHFAEDQIELLQELRSLQVELESRNEELRCAQQELSELHRRYEDLYEFAQQARQQLADEVDARKVAQEELSQKSGELKSRVTELGEANAALQALLRERDRERARLEEKVVCNLNELVRPQLARLAEGQLSSRQRSLLDSIGNSLDEIASPLSRRFIIQASRLTPIETQVAEYIRQGRSTKDIAGLMGVAVCTIDYHRLNIRRRLGLNSKSVNLQSYLRTLL